MKIADYLPPFIRESKEMRELLSAEQAVADSIYAAMSAAQKEFSPFTLTDSGAALYEEFLGLGIGEAFDLERRRDRIKTRLMTSAPITKKLMEETVKKAGGVDAQVTENPDDLTFTVKFVGVQGVPRYIEDVKKEVEKIRPFHLSVIYEYIFTPLQSYGDKTLSQLSGHSLSEMAAGEAL